MRISSDKFLLPLEGKSIKHWCVGLSGGQDSIALLHFLRYTLNTDLPILALHVNHHLQASSDDWEKFCIDVCEAWQVPLKTLSIQVPRDSGEGLEAAARRVRYAALFTELNPGDVLLTAHHAEDQAETVLLQCLRGAGPRGLAAMPLQVENQNGITHYRPFLNLERETIQAYIQQHQLKYIHDPSNENIDFDRNYLRQKVMPLLKARWPSYTKTLMRSARLSAELIHWAEPRWQTLLDTCRDTENSARLNRMQLQALSSYECTEVLRLWLEEQALPLPSEVQMQSVLDLVYRYREDSQAEARWGDVLIRVYRGYLYVLLPTDRIPVSCSRLETEEGHLGHAVNTSLYALTPHPCGVRSQGIFLSFEALSQRYLWCEDQDTVIIEDMLIKREKIVGQGIALKHLQEVQVRFRSQGERFHPAGRQGSHPLKKLFQEWGVPPWQRAHIPLIYAENELIAVVGYAYHAYKLAAENEWGAIFKCKL